MFDVSVDDRPNVAQNSRKLNSIRRTRYFLNERRVAVLKGTHHEISGQFRVFGARMYMLVPPVHRPLELPEIGHSFAG